MRPESLYFLYSPVTRVKGVGGATAKALERLLPPAMAQGGHAVPTVRDLLFHLPSGIVDRRFTCPLSSAPDGVIATFVVHVDAHMPPPNAFRKGGKKPYKVVCSNDTGDITLVFFNAHDDYIKQSLPVGSRRVISGRTEHFDYRLQMTHPDIIAPVDKLAEVQKPEAVYPLTVGLTSRRIARMVDDALDKLPILPEWIEKFPHPQGEGEFPSWKEALRRVHHPETPEDLLPDSPARRRLAYDEILAGQLYLALLRRQRQHQAGEVIAAESPLADAMTQALPFALTPGQQHVIKEIGDDMASGRRMARLLQGDVGSGKTVVALLSMLRVAGQGMQAALMVPTEIVAQQHYETIRKMVGLIKPGGGPNVVLLTGSVKGKAREKALALIASGEAKIVVGTHALFQEQVAFDHLALAVIDEQHRFGVEQRMALTAKGRAPHLLHMTATPIPRSLAMTLYGDMDSSLLMEKPRGRQPIATRLIPLSRYGEIMQRLQAALDRGEKAYWVCPLIEENPENADLYSPDTDIAAAQSRFIEFRARFGDTVGLVHGRMKGEARDAEVRRFAAGDTRLLVATTVVEVGVDVPDATIMVIEKAERFGLSQLHQLRGRVGRGDKPSACVLLYSPSPPESNILGEGGVGGGATSSNAEYAATIPHPNPPPQGGREYSPLSRLSILRESEDGFAIAEADLAMRGGGDLLGSRQSGMPRFVFTDLLRHRDLLEQARGEAARVLQADPSLTGARGQALSVLVQLFGCEITEKAEASAASS